jgi:Lanthionine-containing peptide SapB precursor RamS
VSHVLDLQAMEVSYQRQATEYYGSALSVHFCEHSAVSFTYCDPPTSQLSVILCA